MAPTTVKPKQWKSSRKYRPEEVKEAIANMPTAEQHRRVGPVLGAIAMNVAHRVREHLGEPGAAIVEAVGRAFRRVRGVDQVQGPVKPYCFYGTDAAHLKHRAAMPGIVCGPGGRYNTMPDERVDIPDYLDMIRIYLHAILDICEIA